MGRTMLAPTATFDQTALRCDVRAYIARQGATARWFAHAAGWSSSSMYQWLAGRHDCSANALAGIAVAADLSLDSYIRA